MKTQIQTKLPAGNVWRESLIYYDTIDSTNTRAKAMARDGAPHGTVLIAGHQSAGRGRMGRAFQSPENMGIYMSVILRYTCPPEQLMHLTCAAAEAMCDAVENVAGLRPGIKWTNDLVSGGRKIAGILTELVITPEQTAAVIGIGINCCQQEMDFAPDIRSFAGSLAMATGKPICQADVAAAMILALQEMDKKLLTQKAAILSAYREDCITIGKDVALIRGEKVRHAHALDIDDTGALLVRHPDGSIEAVNSGEVSVRGMYGYV